MRSFRWLCAKFSRIGLLWERLGICGVSGMMARKKAKKTQNRADQALRQALVAARD
jgi:hypothetical protein